MSTSYGGDAPLSYNKYLKVPELIRLQQTLSEPESHDELLFIVIHQTYELWFKQILHELDACIGWMDEGRLFRANHSLRGVNSIERILVTQIHILESMAPIGFLEFRDKLNPASGFQSMQFRELEFSSGAKDEKILESFRDDEFAYERLKARFDAPSLADAFWSLLERSGLAAASYEDRVSSTVKMLAKPERYAELYNMQDLLIEHDELVIAWRYNHIQMVE
ncbi:MAG TPA: tryptophan 2,3-dioxygenase, partial [Blastocatellia bacterium]|nr:tryptophan 2,3-dioxygenase [Blastocatellia bacterium]